MGFFDNPDNIAFLDEVFKEEEAAKRYLLFKKLFSEVCDAFLFYSLPGFTTDVPPECRYLEDKGCFVPNFYMVNPFYYLGEERDMAFMIKNGILFLRIKNDDDLENLKIYLNKYIKKGIFESMPIVLFRAFPPCKYITLDGQLSDDASEDVIQKFNNGLGAGIDGLYEFIGVFKAERKESAEENVYKMTKVFDRYYFNDNKIIN